VSDAVRIFLALIYGVKAATFTYIASVMYDLPRVWPGVILMFTSGCLIVMIATSPGRGR
jgi:hypothetical protein